MHSKAEVVVKDGVEPRGKYVFGPGEYVIGRSESCDIVLQGAGISYRHAQIVITPSRLVVIDLNSTNGTFIGEHRVDGLERISSGDRIHIGAKGIAEIRLIEDEDTAASSDESLSERGKANTEGELFDPNNAVAKGDEGSHPESTAVETDALRQIEKLRADYEDKLRAIKQERVSVVRDRDELRKRLERIERENKAQAAAAVEDWTAMIHEKESALEDLTEIRATHEYQQKEAARKMEELRSAIRERDESLRALSLGLDEDKRQLAVLESKSSREIGERDALLATTAQAVELQKAEIVGLLQQVKQIKGEREGAIEEFARFEETQDARFMKVSAELEMVSRERDALQVKLIEASGHGNCGTSGLYQVREIGSLVPNSKMPPSSKVGDLMTPEELAVIEDADAPESSSGKPSSKATSLLVAEKLGLLRRGFSVVPKKYVLGAGILCACVGLAFGTAAGFSVYKTRQLKSLTNFAASALARGDRAEASLSVRRALQIDQNYLPACRLMAEVSEKMGDSRALVWRRRVVELSAGSVEALIAQAYTALRFGQKSLARETLDRIGSSGRDRADFQAGSAALALADKDRAKAERFYAEAVRLAPDNLEYRVDLAIVQSGSEDYFIKEAGRLLLIEMAENPKLASRSLRGLVASYEKTREFSTALRMNAKLLASGNPALSDEITEVRLLKRTGDPLFGKALTDLETKVGKTPGAATSLIIWMNSEGLTTEVVTWAARAFPEIAKMPGLRAAMAVSLADTRDWSALLDLTKFGPWKEAEYGRQAYRSRALREEGQIGLSRAAWKSAISAASAESDAIAWLAYMATEWNWPEEHEEALLAMVSSSSKDRTALATLSSRYRDAGNTDGLRRLSLRLMEADPSDEQAQNDYVVLSLLLHADVSRALRLASELYNRHPDDSLYISTYAFALNYEGRTEQARQIMEKLSPEKLQEPAFAAYYGIILAASRLPEKAVHFLQIAQNGTLLHEERLLVEKSLQETGYTGPKAE